MAKLRKILFRLLLLAFVLLNISAFLHARKATVYKKGASTPVPFAELKGFEKIKALAIGRSLPRPELTRDPAEVGIIPQTLLIERRRGNIGGWVLESPTPKGVFLLLPDYAKASDSLYEVAKLLNGLGYHCVAIDFHGAGKSAGHKTFGGIVESSDVQVAYRYIGKMYSNLPISIYAAPMGAGAAMKSQFFGSIDPARVIFETPAPNMVALAKTKLAQSGMPGFLAHPILCWGGLPNRMNPYQFTPDKYASGVDCPALLLRGENDTNVTLEEFSEILSRFPQGKVSAKSIPGADSSKSLAQGNPSAWLAEVDEFLKVTSAVDAMPSSEAPIPVP